MKSLNLIVATILAVWGGGAIAQELLVGKYSGQMESARPTGRPASLTLDIASVEGAQVRGTVTPIYPAIRNQSPCSGTSPIEGTLKEKQLVIRMRGGGAASDCSLTLQLTVEGEKLTGTNGTGRRVELSK